MSGRKLHVAGVVGLGLLLGSSVSAQAPLVAGRTRALMGTEREAYIRRNLPLGTEEGRAFWPLYKTYREDMRYVADRTITLFEELLYRYATLTDDDAEVLLDEALAVRQEELDVRTRWASRMRESLSARTVARFYQLENQLDVLVKAELADSMPLVESESRNELIDPPRNPLQDDINRVQRNKP